MSKERTALSVLKGLRIKFAKNTYTQYTGFELDMLLRELLSKIDNDQTINLVDRENEVKKKPNEIWDVVDAQVERSKIKRYPWKKILGKSLTKEILLLKKQGLKVGETYQKLACDDRIWNFFKDNPKERNKALENLEISVHARYGENNTAIKVMQEEKNKIQEQIKESVKEPKGDSQ